MTLEHWNIGMFLFNLNLKCEVKCHLDLTAIIKVSRMMIVCLCRGIRLDIGQIYVHLDVKLMTINIWALYVQYNVALCRNLRSSKGVN